MSCPIVLTDYDGTLMFAFDPGTDPLRVLAQLVWTYANGERSLCGYECPAVDGKYCLDCHSVAYSARAHYEQRTAALAPGHA